MPDGKINLSMLHINDDGHQTCKDASEEIFQSCTEDFRLLVPDPFKKLALAHTYGHGNCLCT